jgi:hypothetical protein
MKRRVTWADPTRIGKLNAKLARIKGRLAALNS